MTRKTHFYANACGFCKYAKFDYTLTCRPVCAVDPIESEEDRRKAVTSINTLLEKADKVYRQLIANRPQIEAILGKVFESSPGGMMDATHPMMMDNNHLHVNVFIQQLAQKYCVESKSLFEDLSSIIQKVMATRKELLIFDKQDQQQHQQMEQEVTNPGKCFGCAAASVEHCLTLLRALATNPEARQTLFELGVISELMDNNLRRGSNSVKCETRKLLSYLTKDNAEAVDKLNSLLYARIKMALKSSSVDLLDSTRHEMSLLAFTVQRYLFIAHKSHCKINCILISRDDSCWEIRMKFVFKIFRLATAKGNNSAALEGIILPCLKILQSFVKPNMVKFDDDKNKKLAFDDLAIDVDKWLNGDQEHSFR